MGFDGERVDGEFLMGLRRWISFKKRVSCGVLGLMKVAAVEGLRCRRDGGWRRGKGVRRAAIEGDEDGY